MPIHDWRVVNPGTFHAFHNSWITHLQESLNEGLLPEGFYALGEQRAGDVGPDLLTLHAETESFGEFRPEPDAADDDGGIAVALHPPQVSLIDEADAEAEFYRARQRTLVIRHVSGDRIVALAEIVSPGNKHNADAVHALVEKSVAAIREGYHLLLIDLFPPGRHDPRGIHGAIWEAAYGRSLYEVPPDRPLTLASYHAAVTRTSYVEPTQFGAPLIDMPLFLSQERYVNVPLEATYLAAWRGVPERWKRVIEGRSASV